jgi:acyl CoA:acetate/3-ketoacid CoA transferase alpha subunit
MIERGGERGFAEQPIERRFIRHEHAPDHLQRDLAFEPPVLGAIHLAHATRAEQGGNLIVAQAASNRKGHCAVRRSIVATSG